MYDDDAVAIREIQSIQSGDVEEVARIEESVYLSACRVVDSDVSCQHGSAVWKSAHQDLVIGSGEIRIRRIDLRSGDLDEGSGEDI